jgi:hypothetical protein
MMNARHLVTVSSAILLVLVAVGCSGAASSSPAGSSAPPVDVLAEVDATAKGVEDAVVAYEAGDAAGATELVTAAYLEHFELLEGALEAVDEELKELLEDKIREEMRAKIAAGAPAAEVRALGTEILDLLDQAKTKLE